MGSLTAVARDALRAELTRRRVARERLTAVLVGAYEAIPDPAFCVRRLEVVEHVARELGIGVVSNPLFLEVTQAAQALGWQPVMNGGRALFRGVKRRDLDLDEALLVSRGHRHDPRKDRSRALGAAAASATTG